MGGQAVWLDLWVYWAIIVLMMTGLYAVISRDNLVKKIMGLNLFQSSAIFFFIAMGKIRGGTAPILVGHGEEHGGVLYSNPVPHVLMLTAIVVGVSVTALALALVIRIQDAYGSVEEDELVAIGTRQTIAEEQART